jgi:hypothetical protein
MRVFGNPIGITVGDSASLATGSISLGTSLEGIQFIYTDGAYTSSLTTGSIGSIRSIITSATSEGAYGSIIIEASDIANPKISGSEVIRFSSSGSLPRVGIGTQNPKSSLQVRSSSPTTGASPDIILTTPSESISVGDETGRITFLLEDQDFLSGSIIASGSTAAIYSRVLGSDFNGAYGSLVFEINDNLAVTEPVKGMELGYGITGGTNIALVISGNIYQSSDTPRLILNDSSTGNNVAYLGNDFPDSDEGQLLLYNNGNSYFKITDDEDSYISSSAGNNFGIGTKNPTEKLDVVGSIALTTNSVSSSLKTINSTIGSDSATNVDLIVSSTFTGVIYDYILLDDTVGVRAGQFMLAHNNGSMTFTDTSTKHLFDGVAPEISASFNDPYVQVQVVNGNGYTFKALRKKL